MIAHLSRRRVRANYALTAAVLHFRYAPIRWGNRPAACGLLKILGAALQTDGSTRSAFAACSIRRRSAAWTILLDWTFRSRKPARPEAENGRTSRWDRPPPFRGRQRKRIGRVKARKVVPHA